MEHLKRIGLGLGLIFGSMSIVLGTVACLCYASRWAIGPGYDWVGPLTVVVLGGAWLVGTVWRD